MLNLHCAIGSHIECDGIGWIAADDYGDCECDCHGLERGISTPLPDDPVESMEEAMAALGIVVPDGEAPTREQVEAVIARRGRWGDPPRMFPCGFCGYWNTESASVCVACNAEGWR